MGREKRKQNGLVSPVGPWTFILRCQCHETKVPIYHANNENTYKNENKRIDESDKKLLFSPVITSIDLPF